MNIGHLISPLKKQTFAEKNPFQIPEKLFGTEETFAPQPQNPTLSHFKSEMLVLKLTVFILSEEIYPGKTETIQNSKSN